jgi:hypothetical protein
MHFKFVLLAGFVDDAADTASKIFCDDQGRYRGLGSLREDQAMQLLGKLEKDITAPLGLGLVDYLSDFMSESAMSLIRLMSRQLKRNGGKTLNVVAEMRFD